MHRAGWLASCVDCIRSRGLLFFLSARARIVPLLALGCDSMDATSSASSSASSSSQPAPTASAVLRALSSDTVVPNNSAGVSKETESLLEQQRTMRAERAQLAKDLRNAQRRRARLKHKARLLSASDLASVLVLRQEEEEAKSVAKRRRSARPGDTEGDARADGELAATESTEGRVDTENGDEDDPRDVADSTRHA